MPKTRSGPLANCLTNSFAREGGELLFQSAGVQPRAITPRESLVLLHAASYTRSMWLPQIYALQNDFRILAPDLPGHGALANQKFTFDAATETVLAAMAQAGMDRALFVGVSLGGMVAMQIAAQCPGSVAGLILSGCTFDPCGLLCQLILTAEGVVFPRGAARWTRNLERYLTARYPAPMAEEMMAGGTYWQAAADAVRAMRGVHFAGQLARYPGPSLILNGAQDWIHRSAEGLYSRAAQKATVQVIPNAGHVANLDQPEAFTQAVRAFAKAINYTTQG